MIFTPSIHGSPRGGGALPATPGTPIHLDGSFGEGGGQILRTSLSLSALTGRPLRLEKIRAGRQKHGLKRQHLTAVKAVAEICGARVEGAELGSMQLDFSPGAIRGGAYRFDVGSAGSAVLVAQTVLPVLLRASESSEIEITGGTHVSFAPCWEFFAESYLPQLRAMGARVEALCETVGSYDLSRKVVAHRVMNAVRKYLKTGAPVGPHLADQLAVPIIALTGEGSFVKGKDTLHETTNWAVVRAFLTEAAIERTESEGDPSIRLRIRR